MFKSVSSDKQYRKMAYLSLGAVIEGRQLGEHKVETDIVRHRGKTCPSAL